MEHVDELISGYALHGLDAADERLVLEHVETCERCRVQLREMEAVAAALAFAAPQADPPPELRDRLLEAIDPEVVPSAPLEARPQPRARWWWWPRFSAVAVPVLGLAVIALTVWNISLSGDVNDSAVRSVAPIANVGDVVSFSGGQAAVVGGLKPAPAGHTYEAWVIPRGQTVPQAAGTFAGGDDLSFTLTRNASVGDTIVITLEPGTGGSAPKGPVVGKTSI
ncbi:MAG TPA: anti-sigma factor [Gaiellales bacterium]|nr:anti-sigma factor [Gaiellales bacterium]